MKTIILIWGLLGALMALWIAGLANAHSRVETIELPSRPVPSLVKMSVLLPLTEVPQ